MNNQFDELTKEMAQSVTRRAALKKLREVLEERLRWLDEWEKAAKVRKDAEHPQLSPAREAGELKAELERTRASLDQAAKALHLTGTTNWIAKVKGREIDPNRSYVENDLKGKVDIDWGPRESGGGAL